MDCPSSSFHGSFDDHNVWAPVLPAFEERFTVYAVDRRGRGGSGDGIGYSLESEAARGYRWRRRKAQTSRGPKGEPSCLGPGCRTRPSARWWSAAHTGASSSHSARRASSQGGAAERSAAPRLRPAQPVRRLPCGPTPVGATGAAAAIDVPLTPHVTANPFPKPRPSLFLTLFTKCVE
jgi:hypothetical protein